MSMPFSNVSEIGSCVCLDSMEGPEDTFFAPNEAGRVSYAVGWGWVVPDNVCALATSVPDANEDTAGLTRSCRISGSDDAPNDIFADGYCPPVNGDLSV